MTRARQELVSLSDTPYYHCIARCVRRAFLCGEDTFSGRSYEHRKGWIVERMKQLSAVFAVDVCAYAVMSNHFHLVVKVDGERARRWSTDEVIERWCTLFSGPESVQRYAAGGELSAAEANKVSILSEEWRLRLSDLSWYMRCLNEHIARRANVEDQCTGRFWEGRFKSQALLDEQALLTCMAYVDLNPIRAGLAETPETSEFTSIYERIHGHASETPVPTTAPATPDDRSEVELTAEDQRILKQTELLNFEETGQNEQGIPYAHQEYLDLVDWSGRAIRAGKRGAIPANLPPILSRLGIDAESLVGHLRGDTNGFVDVIGRPAEIKRAAMALRQKFVKGLSAAEALFGKRRVAEPADVPI